MALAAGASIAAAANPADDQQIVLLATDEPQSGSAEAPRAEDVPVATPSVPRFLASDDAGESNEPGPDSSAASFIDTLQVGTCLLYTSDAADE